MLPEKRCSLNLVCGAKKLKNRILFQKVFTSRILGIYLVKYPTVLPDLAADGHWT